MLKTIEEKTPPGESMTDITKDVNDYVQESGIKEGICVVCVPHTTAAVTVNSAIDPLTMADIVSEVHRLIPTRVDFQHVYDTPADAAGHIKASLIGNDVTLMVSGGELMLGSSQSLMFFEFDGPRKRRVLVRVIPDHS